MATRAKSTRSESRESLFFKDYFQSGALKVDLVKGYKVKGTNIQPG